MVGNNAVGLKCLCIYFFFGHLDMSTHMHDTLKQLLFQVQILNDETLLLSVMVFSPGLLET